MRHVWSAALVRNGTAEHGLLPEDPAALCVFIIESQTKNSEYIFKKKKKTFITWLLFSEMCLRSLRQPPLSVCLSVSHSLLPPAVQFAY